MTFSVLISIYYKENPIFFDRAMQSIWDDQTIKPNEIVLVQDGPLTKKLDEKIGQWKEKLDILKIVPLEKNKDLGGALRIGIEACSNEIIARMDTDDISFPHRFEKQIDFLRENPEISIVGSNIDEFEDNETKIVSKRVLPSSNNEIIKFSKYRNPFNHMSVVFRKSAILDVGNYKPFLLFEDYYLWIRLINSGYKTANLNESLVKVRIKGMHQKRKGWSYIKNEIRLQKKFNHIGFTSKFEMFRNIIVRNIPRVLPLSILKFIYKKFIRSRV